MVTVGMAAENEVMVTPEMTVGHVLPGMPAVYGTPTMILHIEIAATLAIRRYLPAGHVSVSMMVNVRHFAATPIGRTVRAVARVTRVEEKSVLFEVEAWDGDRKIGDGSHRRGIVNLAKFEKRSGVAISEWQVRETLARQVADLPSAAGCHQSSDASEHVIRQHRALTPFFRARPCSRIDIALDVR